jgi:hypothetical protein
MNPDGLYFPDANSTMRLSYGSVKGYSPADGVSYNYYTTIEGIMEKHNPDHHEFVLPQKLIQLYKDRDFGPYGDGTTLRVNFVADNHTTGGNSGSPVLNKYGHLVGVNFDRAWEAVGGDVKYLPHRQRCIVLDIRYVLFIIDKFAGASHLIDEMTIIEAPAK